MFLPFKASWEIFFGHYWASQISVLTAGHLSVIDMILCRKVPCTCEVSRFSFQASSFSFTFEQHFSWTTIDCSSLVISAIILCRKVTWVSRFSFQVTSVSVVLYVLDMTTVDVIPWNPVSFLSVLEPISFDFETKFYLKFWARASPLRHLT